jgi:hypothetical protein
MFECTICGLLSLGGNACPACGSQIRVDLAEHDDDGSPLPTEVPGLDEAVASWNELEGIEAQEENEQQPDPAPAAQGSLPFGFSGASNTNISRLPFGIGSSAAGMPFDEAEEGEQLPLVSSQSSGLVEQPNHDSKSVNEPSVEPVHTEPNVALFPNPPPLEATNPPKPEATGLIPLPTVEPELPALVPQTELTRLQAMPIPSDELPRIDAASVVSTPSESAEPNVAEPEFDSDVPAMWRIDAAPPNMEQIYSEEDQVVEVVHTMDAEPTMYAHESTEMVDNELMGVISLDLHPAQALSVRLDGLPELETTLQQGFEALGQESWAKAAIAFQKLASRMPGDAAVFNNYGLSLLQRALTMAKSPDLEVQTLASTQFESSILALREAAKSAPTEGVILLNLAHALLVSGRAEKAIGLIQMHDQTQPQTGVSGNLHAAALVSMGESSAAKTLLQRLAQDDVIRANLERLSY